MSAPEELRDSPPHGQKRVAEDDLRNEQRLAKRFNLLNLGKLWRARSQYRADKRPDHTGKLYIPFPSQQQQLPPSPPPVRRSRSNAFSDSMNMDDSRDRIYIHNLDEELADISSDEEKLIFLPDIERRFTKIPHSVLASDLPPKLGNEMILYGVPTSISVPEEQDIVRKAIIESRQRAREHALEQELARQRPSAGGDQPMDYSIHSNLQLSSDGDSEAMDMS
ncbi:MAG: hypothetical protein LQ340_003950 [Diploschistes diacapsis]|nr:MAG: hypothetical protein LQ340_003950 [Diploschistes diacapsis]